MTRVARLHSRHAALAKRVVPVELPWLAAATLVAWAISSERLVALRMSALATEGVCVFSAQIQTFAWVRVEVLRRTALAMKVAAFSVRATWQGDQT